MRESNWPQASLVRRLVLIIGAGVGSRVIHTGFVIFDKYLGDALYAAMIHTIVALLWRRAAPNVVAVTAMLAMTGIELFQLTMIPAAMAASGHLCVRVAARLIGTEFSFRDMLAYAAGIGCIVCIDRLALERATMNPSGGEPHP